jgi:dolichol kinase
MIVPLLFVLLFLAIGTGKTENEAFVASMSRSGDPSELLKGTLYYAIWIVIITVVWFYVPAGNIAGANPLALVIIGGVAGGDGFADVIGRKFGGERKFGIGGAQKTIAGTIGMFIFSVLFSIILIAMFSLETGFDIVALLIPLIIISLVATIVEAISPPNLDNWTVPIVVIVMAFVLSQVSLWPFALTTF